MSKKVAKTGLKWKRKKWFSIEAPQSLGGRIVGETLADNSVQLKGRCVSVSLMQLSGNIKKQNLFVNLRVKEVVNNVGKTEPYQFYMQPYSIKRLVRPETSNLEDSFCCATSDNIIVRIKPMGVTRTQVNSGVLKAIRRAMIPAIIREVKKISFEELMISLSNFDLQKDVKKVLDKVYPLKSFQIKSCALETKKKKKVLDAPAEEATREEEINEEFEEAEEATENSEGSAEAEETVGEESEDAPEEESVEEIADEDALEEGAEESLEEDPQESVEI